MKVPTISFSWVVCSLMAFALALAFAIGAGTADSGLASTVRRSCPVTIPTRAVPPGAGFTAAGFNYGNTRLRAHLWPHGTLIAGALPGGGSWATINADGSIRTKQGWWRGVQGKLMIKGRRLDAPASQLRAHVPDGYASRGFQPVALTFPTVGCWRVVGRIGRVNLTFVVKVTTVRGTSG